MIGAFLLWTHRQYSTLVNDQFWEPFGIIIVLGLVTQLMCYLGWTATTKKHRCYLGTFCAFLVIQIVIQFLISGWAYATKVQLITPAELAIKANFDLFISKEESRSDQTHIWNRLQRDMECCGALHPIDYIKIGVPWSCNDPISTNRYDVGCMHVLVKHIQWNMIRVSVLAVSTALIQSLGIFCVIQLVLLLKRPRKMLPNGDNHSLRAKRTREQMPLSASSISHPVVSSAPTMPHPSSSTKPPIAQKPIVPKIEHPIIK